MKQFIIDMNKTHHDECVCFCCIETRVWPKLDHWQIIVLNCWSGISESIKENSNKYHVKWLSYDALKVNDHIWMILTPSELEHFESRGLFNGYSKKNVGAPIAISVQGRAYFAINVSHGSK